MNKTNQPSLNPWRTYNQITFMSKTKVEELSYKEGIAEAVNQKMIDAWNKEMVEGESPENQYTFDEVANGLEHCVDSAVYGIIDSLLEKYNEGKFQVEQEYISCDTDDVSKALRDTEAVHPSDFESLVLARISSLKDCKIFV